MATLIMPLHPCTHTHKPGNYSITSYVGTAQCPTSFNAVTKTVVVEQAIPGITYPDKDAAYNFDQQLQARNIGTK